MGVSQNTPQAGRERARARWIDNESAGRTSDTHTHRSVQPGLGRAFSLWERSTPRPFTTRSEGSVAGRSGCAPRGTDQARWSRSERESAERGATAANATTPNTQARCVFLLQSQSFHSHTVSQVTTVTVQSQSESQLSLRVVRGLFWISPGGEIVLRSFSAMHSFCRELPCVPSRESRSGDVAGASHRSHRRAKHFFGAPPQQQQQCS